jgi:hypothetical protein
MSNQIQIKITGSKIPPDKFLEAVKEFISLVQGVAKNVTNTPIDWAVEVDRGSAIIRLKVENPSTESERSIEAVAKGIRALRSGVKAPPYGFTRDSIHSAKILAELADGQNVQSVSIQNGDAPEDIPPSLIAIADGLLARQHHDAFGSIEGKIISLSARHGFICIIHDPIEQRDITCYLQTDESQRLAHAGYTRRVLAGGLIHYAAEGHPVSITVDEMRIFPPDSELPTAQDVQAIYAQYK